METARLFVRVLRVCVTMIKTSGFYSSFFFFNTNGSNEREEKLDERPGREVDIKGFEKEGTEKGNEARRWWSGVAGNRKKKVGRAVK